MSSSQKQSKTKTTSTARRLNNVWLLRLLGIFICIDVLILIIFVFGFFITAERYEFGNQSKLNQWNMGWNEDTVTNRYKHQTNEQDNLFDTNDYFSVFKYNDSQAVGIMININDHTIHYVAGEEQGYNEADITLVIEVISNVYLLLLIIEAVILCCNAMFGVFAIRRKLRSLDQMAFIASELGNRADIKDDGIFHFDEEKVHNLEDAIAKITPNGPDCALHTTDAELKGLEIAINGLLERMRASYQQQSRFVSDASHELRTPIAVIQGYVNMLDRWGKKDEKVLEESIDAIKHESNHMKKLVEQLLFLARGDSGRNKFVLEQVNLNDVVKEVYEESLMIDENHIYHCQLADAADYVYADSSMLKQAVRILTENAAKYTAAHEQIRIGCGMDEQGIPFIYVQDNGIGMKSEDAAHAFERFYRADNARDSKTGGTGLGLSIAKWIIDRHYGYFKVLSFEEIGTRISICLPQDMIRREWEKGAYSSVDGKL